LGVNTRYVHPVRSLTVFTFVPFASLSRDFSGTSPHSGPTSSSSISGQAGPLCCTPCSGTVMPAFVGEEFPLIRSESVPPVNSSSESSPGLWVALCPLVCSGGSRHRCFWQGMVVEGDDVSVSSSRSQRISRITPETTFDEPCPFR